MHSTNVDHYYLIVNQWQLFPLSCWYESFSFAAFEECASNFIAAYNSDGLKEDVKDIVKVIYPENLRMYIHIPSLNRPVMGAWKKANK